MALIYFSYIMKFSVFLMMYNIKLLRRYALLMAFLSLPIVAYSQTLKEDNPDPWEGFNRSMFAVNEALDTWLLRPVAVGYDYIAPKPVDRSVGHFFNNLKEPVVLVSNLLQLKIVDASVDLSRFLINSTVGFFGVFDVASKIGLTSHNEDFGQVFASWGISSGPYLVLPVFGVYTLRSFSGELVTGVSGLAYTRIGQNEIQKTALFALDNIQTRAHFLAQESLITGDKYIFIRSIYLQHRAYLTADAQSTNTQDEFADEFIDETDETFIEATDEEINSQQAPNRAIKDNGFKEDDWLFEE